MDIGSVSLYLLAILILITGIGVTLWAHYVGIFCPIQWLAPYNKLILITGCDSGIGFELAKHFHQKGCVVIATVLSNKSPGALNLLSELSHDRFFLLELDLNSVNENNQFFLELENIFKKTNLGLHALINNAGICVFGEFDFHTRDQIKDQININLLGTIYLTKKMLPYLIESNGRVVNVSSVNAIQAFPGLSIYSATKKALESFSEALRIELLKFNIKVIIVRLGDFAKLTNIMKNHQEVINAQKQKLDHQQKKLYGDYFERFHDAALKNYGMFSPKDYKSSTLFTDFEEAVLSVDPRNTLLCATLSYKFIIYFLYIMPDSIREFIFQKFSNTMVKDKKVN